MPQPQNRIPNILVLPAALSALALLVACGAAGADPESSESSRPSSAASAPLRPVNVGGAFPSGTYSLLNRDRAESSPIDLGSVLGKKPVVLFYWIARHDRAEQLFEEVEALVDEIGADRIALFGAAVPRPGIDAAAIGDRIAELGIRAPVLEDTDFRIGKMLRVQSVPNITLIDSDGIVRLTNGASLRQVLGYKLDLAGAIRGLAETGTSITYGHLDRYFPAKELEGTDCPDFRAPLVDTRVEQRYYSMLEDDALNVLIFWSVDCAHCRKSLPAINAWLGNQPQGVRVVTAATVTNEAGRAKTRDFCAANGFQFETLLDQDAKIGQQFRVTTTPTIMIIGPDRKIESVITSSTVDLSKEIEETRRRLLGAPPTS